MANFLRSFLNIAAIAALLPGLIWGCGFIIFAGSVNSMIEPSHIIQTDGIIVLTGGTNRVTRGLDLLAQNKAHDLLISGVHKDVKLSELLTLWGYKANLPDCCITLGREAGNTIGNAKEAKKWIDETKVNSIRLITANYHMPRAKLELRNALPEMTIIPHPVSPEGFSPKHREFWKIVFLEYHKYLMTLLRVTFFPHDTSPIPQALQ